MTKRRIKVTPGDKYGDLMVISEADPTKWGKYKIRMVLCQCNCGNRTTVRLDYLRNGHTRSCGCKRIDELLKHRKTHGCAGSRLYRIWAGMLSRCRNKNNPSYKNYGAKSTSVCEEWEGFENFKKWAIENGYNESLTIERKDVWGDYNPNNCCWIPHKDQMKNKRIHRLITYSGKTKKISEWANELNIHPNTISSRIKRGWTTKDALEKPLDNRGKRHV